ncbi:MAG: hypothetical protein HY774_06820 [Acidobacteria bacterium]|nr:hypothetical protein [Acidobacteriota bacterium]
MSFPLALNDALAGIGFRPGRDRGLRTTAIKQRPCGPKILILALMGPDSQGSKTRPGLRAGAHFVG